MQVSTSRSRPRCVRSLGALLSGLLACLGAAAQDALPLPNLNLRDGGSVRAIARAPDGSVVLGGSFTFINGALRQNVARLRPDGTLDPDWQPQVSSDVTAIAIDAAGFVYLGGFFTNVGADTRGGLAKISPTGELDAAWNPSAGGTQPDTVDALALGPDGSLYVGGFFKGFAGETRQSLVKVSTSAEGELDAGWNPDMNGQVFALAMSGDDLLVGGLFTQIGGAARANFARLLPGGSADPVFVADTDSVVYAIARRDGEYYIGGGFTTVQGAPRERLAKLDVAGALDPSWMGSANGDVLSLAVDASSVYLGGGFSSVGGQARRNVARVARAAAGAVDTTWNPRASSTCLALLPVVEGTVMAGGFFKRIGNRPQLGFGIIANSGISSGDIHTELQGRVNAIARQRSGGLIVAGLFQRANETFRAGLLRINADGTLDGSWNPNPDASVEALAVDIDERVYAGGAFTSIGRSNISYVARLEGSGTGAADPSWAPAPSDVVRALAVSSTASVVFMGGDFSAVGGAARGRVAKVSMTSGALDPAWAPAFDRGVRVLTLDGSVSVYAGGIFEHVGSLARGRIAKLSASGSGAVDASWDPSLNGGVNALRLRDGWVYAGGSFTQADGMAVHQLVRLADSGSGALDTTWLPALNGNVHAIAPFDDSIFVGGVFSNFDGTPQRGIARVFYDAGASLVAWNPALSGSVFALSASPTGVLTVGGNFSNVGAAARRALASIRTDVLFDDGFE